MRLILLQLFVALTAIVLGADLFVRELTKLAEAFSVPPLVISLLLTPVATELPAKSNCVMWMRERKDTLALENITGAMVFQSAIPVAIGVAFTPWQLDAHGLLAPAWPCPRALSCGSARKSPVAWASGRCSPAPVLSRVLRGYPVRSGLASG